MKVLGLDGDTEKCKNRSSLHKFCELMLDKYRNPNRMSAELVAGEFVRFFRLPEYVTFEDIESLCTSLGICTEVGSLPFELKGLNFAYEGQLSIVYPESQWKGEQLIALLHELWELMCKIFEEINPGLSVTKKEAEFLAEEFASCVTMQKPRFIMDTFDTFFNPIKLQRIYGLSYHFILKRMVKVLNRAIPLSVTLFQNVKLLALYESISKSTQYKMKVKEIVNPEDPENFVVTLSSQTKPFKSKQLSPIYAGLVPKKGSSIINHSHALNVLSLQESVLDYRHPLPGSDEYAEIRQLELISDGFLSTHSGVPANIILISIPDCFRRKYDLKYVNSRYDPLMQNVSTMGEALEELLTKSFVAPTQSAGMVSK